jgi:hypothetical protein
VWRRRSIRNVAPTPLGHSNLARYRVLGELREVCNIGREIVGLVFDRPLRFKGSALVLIEPIDLLANPAQLAALLHPQSP